MKFRLFLLLSLCIFFGGCGKSYSDEIMLDELTTESIPADNAGSGAMSEASGSGVMSEAEGSGMTPGAAGSGFAMGTAGSGARMENAGKVATIGIADSGAPGDDPSPADSIYVYVCGEVKSPGVIEVGSDSRVFEALEIAGGVTADADISLINQAERCYDGQKLYVPAYGESVDPGGGVPAPGDSAFVPADSDGLVNINTADSEKLQTLNGIGASRAEDIISYRETNGRFDSIEDIMGVPGIKQATFDKIKDRIKV
ncbi:MAG: ComEA family DNA-binding protein [Lachnospiraceae bacterium]|nr:ComEA family DNA-binding protein [Lachnospiraceae bacterium]